MKLSELSALADGDLKNALVAKTPGGIEAQEAQGQKDLIRSSYLPKECPRDELEALGFKFGEDHDDIFINVEMPKGWSKRATDSAYWTDLIDNEGVVRGAIFYKAAFYDRRASMKLEGTKKA